MRCYYASIKLYEEDIMKKILIVLATFGVGFGSQLIANTIVTYVHPKTGGVALDWCKTFSNGCGKPAADYFCKAKGHRWAVSFAREDNIGYTRIIKTGQICHNSTCDGFKYIKCRKKVLTVKKTFKHFKWPKISGVALDWCYTYANGCGLKAANEFCKSKGYWKGAKSFAKEDNVGYTKIIRTGQICNNAGCDTFKYIDCKK